MAFDPVRDAILNSPERTSYLDPFDEAARLEEGALGATTVNSTNGSFKVPDDRLPTSRNGSSHSPDRLFSQSYSTVETPGGLTVPPTPGTATSEDGRPTTASGQRTSSIFSLLSPEPPADESEESHSSRHNGYFDDFQKADSPQAYDRPVPTVSKQIYHEPELARQKPTSSQLDSKQGLKASLTVESTNGGRSGSSRPTSSSSSAGPRRQPTPSAPPPIIREPVKRGRPYAPYRRQGPPPPSLHIPITPEELAFYRNPANCKNPLREGVQVSGRSPPPIRESLRQDMKGKGRAPTAPPDDVDIAPQYVEPGPLPSSLQPGPIVRRRPSFRRNRSSSSSPKKRKRDSFAGSPVTGEGSQVAAFYNKRLNFSREERNFSPIIGLKSFNNWVKSVLIAKYARDYHQAAEESHAPSDQGRRGGRRRQTPFRVLDIGCGKGGDLQKWQKAGITDYVAIDIAEVSIQQARRRWDELRGPRFDAHFYALDAYSNPLTAIVPESILTDPPFDVVTMQFCMHYAFQSVPKARMMLENVSRYLKKGGTFIGTIPDSEQLLTRLKELPPDANPLAFGNEVYRIVFDDRSKFPAFGHRYTFYLTDAVEDVPEYVVQWDAFETLAAEYNLKLLYHATFHELFSAERENPEFEQLLVKMRVVTPEGESELTEDQWEAANIYVAFAFVKI